MVKGIDISKRSVHVPYNSCLISQQYCIKYNVFSKTPSYNSEDKTPQI